MITPIPLKPIPNQIFGFSIDGEDWEVELNSRLGNLYATVTKSGEPVVSNRICRNLTYICKWLIFADQEGNTDPVHTGLGTRYKLVWADGV